MKSGKLNSANEERVSYPYYLWIRFRLAISRFSQRISNFRKRRPHKSFRLSKRRDYKRTLKMPGYIKFTKQVIKQIWENKKTFFMLIALIITMSIALIGLLDQSFLDSLNEILNESSENFIEGGLGNVGKAGLLLLSTMSTGGLTQSLNEGQQIILILMILFSWLAIMWILRNALVGKKIRLRDALYNCGSPIISTASVAILMFIQMIPVFLVVIAYSAAVSTDFLKGGVETMVFVVVALLLISMSVYWLIGSFFALIIVAIPGMYPMKAIRMAGDMVVGRRMKILLRMLWCVFVSALLWAIIMIPVILLMNVLNSSFETLASVPIIPFVMLVVSCIVLLFTFSYTYLFYREVVRDDSQTA